MPPALAGAATARALADVTGVETIKTLVACLGVPDFTVDELAQQTGVSRRTVDTVVRRYQHAFDRLPSGKQGGPGRPPVRWRLRADHLDEVLAAVGSHQAALGRGRRSEVADAPGPDTAEASLIMAATALARGSDDAGQTKQLVAAARNSLVAAGFGSDGSPWTAQPDQGLAGRARFIAAVADVVDACLSGDQQRIDEAQARAMPHVEDAKRYMSATEWMPLAQKVLRAPGTVLSAPVLVEKDSVSYFRKLFPTLQAFLRKKDVPAGFVFMTDTRAEQPASSVPVMSLLNFKDPAETKLKWADAAKLPDCVVVSNKPEVLESVAEHGARFILHRKNKATKTAIANVVNWCATWRVGPPGEVTTWPGGAIKINVGLTAAAARPSPTEDASTQEKKPAQKAAQRGRAGKMPRNDPSVTGLAGRAAAGDLDAWNGITDRYAPLIWSICRRYGLDSAEAEGVGQIVWLRLVDQLASLRDPAALPGWLATTARRECLRVASSRSDLRALSKLVYSPADDVITDEEILTRNAALRAAFAELPPSSRRLLSMLISDPPRSYAEIHAELGIPVGSIGPQRARSLDRLRRLLGVAALTGDEAKWLG